MSDNHFHPRLQPVKYDRLQAAAPATVPDLPDSPYVVAIFAKGNVTGDPVRHQGFATQQEAEDFLLSPMDQEVGAYSFVRINGEDVS